MKSLDQIQLLAIDLGAESGRAILGHFDGQRLELEEIHRFPNGPVALLIPCIGSALAVGGNQGGLAKAVQNVKETVAWA
jgi:hypothetical protein